VKLLADEGEADELEEGLLELDADLLALVGAERR
jgi:hypothetical protein